MSAEIIIIWIKVFLLSSNQGWSSKRNKRGKGQFNFDNYSAVNVGNNRIALYW